MRTVRSSRADLPAVRALGLAATLSTGVLTPAAAVQVTPPFDYTQVTRPVVEVTDSALIRFLLFELVIEPLEPATRLQVIDVTQNGYGPDDVIIVYPTVETFLIPELLPDSVQSVMSTWAPEAEFRLDAGNLPADALAALIASGPDSSRRAENAILYDVVQAVERNYRDLPVGIRFERDSVGFTFEIWDYNRSAMQYTPRPVFTPDSAVSSVVSLLGDIGYVPGRGVAPPAGGRVPSVDQALLGIRSFPSGEVQQLAARTVLLGSYDFDRSGAIDAARELDALPCEVWKGLDGTFPGFVDRFGFADETATYLGRIVLGISEGVRGAAGRRALACLAGQTPPPTPADAVTTVARTVTIPPGVADHLALEGATEIIRRAAGVEPGSASWAAAVKTVMVGRFDTDSSGLVDQPDELVLVPCEIWTALLATNQNLVTDLGLDDPEAYGGDRIGVAAGLRASALDRVRTCAGATGTTTVRRVATRNASRAAVEANPNAAVTPISGIRDFPIERRQLAARTILVAFFDFDGSGYLDAAREIDAISCPVWNALGVTFPDFAATYGFTPDAPSGGPYRGSLVFNISDRVREPATRRMTACANGEAPPPTRLDEVGSAGTPIRLPPTLREFLDTEVAARIARTTRRTEPGSAAWAAAIRRVLLEEYDLDRSGWVDDPVEVDEVPCIVWATVMGTFGGEPAALGFGGAGPYLGDRIGVAPQAGTRVAQRLAGCR